jgi:hypothetical protein
LQAETYFLVDLKFGLRNWGCNNSNFALSSAGFSSLNHLCATPLCLFQVEASIFLLKLQAKRWMYCRTWGCEAYDKLIEHTLERRRKPICSQCVKVLYRYCKTCERFENYNRANDNHLCGFLVGDYPCGGTLHSPKHNKTRSTCHEFQPTKSGHAPNYGIRG